ncbi:MAG: helix-turn-helix transcriptional regulator [Bacteroidales bacterium]|nr:helix-turn-helix transcriptional regulator [Bacteroidales bacterium]
MPVFQYNDIAENSYRNILTIIRQKKEVSGAELARISGMQPSSIVYVLRWLSKHNWITQCAQGTRPLRAAKNQHFGRLCPTITLCWA